MRWMLRLFHIIQLFKINVNTVCKFISFLGTNYPKFRHKSDVKRGV